MIQRVAVFLRARTSFDRRKEQQFVQQKVDGKLKFEYLTKKQIINERQRCRLRAQIKPRKKNIMTPHTEYTDAEIEGIYVLKTGVKGWYRTRDMDKK